MKKTLRLILGDQLNNKHSWYRKHSDEVIYCMFEMRQETDYVTHHIQKIIGFFLAMRTFNSWLKSNDFETIYYRINDLDNQQSLTNNLSQLIASFNITHFEYQLPDEYRLDKQLLDFCHHLSISSQVYDTEHFYTSRDELSLFFKGKKQFLMESFYRYMRKKHDLLMTSEQPEGGTWNYDKSNRKKWKNDISIPKAYAPENEISQLLTEIKKADIKTIGIVDDTFFTFPISRKQCIEQLSYFCQKLLVHFGDFQDAMHTKEINLFHSRLSFGMNTKMISPKDVIKTVLKYYRQHEKEIDISQVEGFIRQILGWREYMRGMYWKEMPEYATLNALENYQPLPDFYWTAKTKMNCMHQSIQNSLDNAYAHHIQRLMITGNFALLIQVHPDAIDQWYLGIYIDAIEWVEITNTRGMSQFADGGIIATKPYVSSASYISKMSNYCDRCHYNKKERLGENACPFNSLYWNFLNEKKSFLQSNYRMSMMYRLLDKISASELERIKERAYNIIKKPDEY